MLYGRQLERHELHLTARTQKQAWDFVGPSKQAERSTTYLDYQLQVQHSLNAGIDQDEVEMGKDLIEEALGELVGLPTN